LRRQTTGAQPSSKHNRLVQTGIRLPGLNPMADLASYYGAAIAGNCPGARFQASAIEECER